MRCDILKIMVLPYNNIILYILCEGLRDVPSHRKCMIFKMSYLVTYKSETWESFCRQPYLQN